MFDVSKKRVLVTGSTQGIGRAIAAAFAGAGASVWVHGSRQEKTCRAAGEIGQGARPAWADLAQRGAARALFEQTGPVDVLVLNASVQFRKAWQEITPQEFETQVQVNLGSSLALMQLYEPEMAKNHWGRIITIGSVQQTVPHKDMAVYAASKCGLLSLVRNLAKQTAADGVTINNIAPGAMLTPRNRDVVADPAYLQKVLAGIPLGRMGTERDCSGLCLLLASEEGGYITGADIYVDGGMSL